MTFLVPILYVIFLWWFTTGIIIAIYGRGQRVMEMYFAGATALLIAAFWGLFISRGLRGTLDVYVAITCGVVIWGWQVTAYYLGFISGPGNKDDLPAPHVQGWRPGIGERFRLALNLTIHHELMVLFIGGLMVALTWGHANQWGVWIYVALWLMHTSAKVNVFLGVRNFDVSFLPDKMQYIDRLLSKRPHNELLPVSVVVASSVTLLLVYRGIEPGTNPAHTVGFLIVATMIGLGVIEHCLLVMPIPSTLVGWGLRDVPDGVLPMPNTLQPAYATVPATVPTVPAPRPREWGVPLYMRTAGGNSTATRPNAKTQHTLTFERPPGPLVVDVWEPRHFSAALPILLIHGWGNSGRYWRQTAFDLSLSNRVIVPDLPGTGRSQPVKGAQTMFDQVDTLADMLDLLDLNQVQVVGHSMGGAMGLLLAGKEPERVSRIVLTSLSFFMNESQRQFYGTIMQFYRLSMPLRAPWLANMPGLKEMLATQYFYRVPDDPELLRQGLLDYLTLDAGTALACADDATDPRIPQAGERLQVPALLVACREDRSLPEANVQYTLDRIPNSDVRWIEACGHLPMIEQSDQYIAILRDFLDVGDTTA